MKYFIIALTVLPLLICKKIIIKNSDSKLPFSLNGTEHNLKNKHKGQFNALTAMDNYSHDERHVYLTNYMTNDSEQIIFEYGFIEDVEKDGLSKSEFESQIKEGNYNFNEGPLSHLSMEIIYKEGDNEWTSRLNPQPNSSNFHIDKVKTAYTRTVTARSKFRFLAKNKGSFTCVLWNAVGDSITISNAEFNSILNIKDS